MKLWARDPLSTRAAALLLVLVLVGVVARLGLGLGLVACRSDNHGGLSPECVAGLK